MTDAESKQINHYLLPDQLLPLPISTEIANVLYASNKTTSTMNQKIAGGSVKSGSNQEYRSEPTIDSLMDIANMTHECEYRMSTTPFAPIRLPPLFQLKYMNNVQFTIHDKVLQSYHFAPITSNIMNSYNLDWDDVENGVHHYSYSSKIDEYNAKFIKSGAKMSDFLPILHSFGPTVYDSAIGVKYAVKNGTKIPFTSATNTNGVMSNMLPITSSLVDTGDIDNERVRIPQIIVHPDTLTQIQSTYENPIKHYVSYADTKMVDIRDNFSTTFTADIELGVTNNYVAIHFGAFDPFGEREPNMHFNNTTAITIPTADSADWPFWSNASTPHTLKSVKIQLNSQTYEYDFTTSSSIVVTDPYNVVLNAAGTAIESDADRAKAIHSFKITGTSYINVYNEYKRIYRILNGSQSGCMSYARFVGQNFHIPIDLTGVNIGSAGRKTITVTLNYLQSSDCTVRFSTMDANGTPKSLIWTGNIPSPNADITNTALTSFKNVYANGFACYVTCVSDRVIKINNSTKMLTIEVPA